MVVQNFIASYMAIWIFIIATVLIYAGLKAIKLPGNDMVLALVSVLMSAMLISSIEITDYLSNVIPYLTLLLFLSFLIMLTLALVAIKMDNVKKPLTWIGLILIFVIIVFMAFEMFPVIQHLLPGTSDSYLSENTRDFKDFIYSNEVVEVFWFVVSIVIVGFMLLKKK